MKKTLLIITTALLLLSCKSQVLKGNESVQDRLISAQYTVFDGQKNYALVLDRASSIRFDITTESGKLTLCVTDGQVQYYSGNISEDFSFSLNVPEGNYQISVKGRNHRGSFLIRAD